MKTVAALLVSLSTWALLAGCNTLPRQPEIQHAGIEPAELKPGDSALITVEISDQYDIVDRIEGTVQEDETITFKLRDDGVAPDAVAGDGIWTLQVDVPFNAPPGDFELALKAYDSHGEVILVRDSAGDAVPLAASFGLVIRYPEQP